MQNDDQPIETSEAEARPYQPAQPCCADPRPDCMGMLVEGIGNRCRAMERPPSWQAPAASAEPVAKLRFGNGDDIPSVLSWNSMPAGTYKVYAAPVAAQAMQEPDEPTAAPNDLPAAVAAAVIGAGTVIRRLERGDTTGALEVAREVRASGVAASGFVAAQAPQSVKLADAQQLADNLAVDEALAAFSDDSTRDNAVVLVQTIMAAQAANNGDEKA